MRREEDSELPNDELKPEPGDIGSVPQEETKDALIEDESLAAAEAFEEIGSVDESDELATQQFNPVADQSEDSAAESVSQSEFDAALPSPSASATSQPATSNAPGEPTPPRRARWLDPHNPYIEKPGPFMQLVLGRTTWQAPPPDAEEAASASSPPAMAPPPPDRSPPDQNYRPFDPAEFMAASTSAAIAVSVQVSLTEEAIRRVAETSAAENAAKTQQQVELLARKIFALEQQIFEREANRRALARHWRHY